MATSRRFESVVVRDTGSVLFFAGWIVDWTYNFDSERMALVFTIRD